MSEPSGLEQDDWPECDYCGEPLPARPPRRDARYCCNAHRQAAYQLRKAEAEQG